MSLTAMWIHGSSVTIETPGSFSSISRFGFGTDTFLNVDQESWMHAAIPTPAFLLDRRPRLRRVIVLFSAEGSMDELHIFDASNRIRVKNFGKDSGFLLHGVHLTQDDMNTINFGDNTLEISFAVGISMHWHWGDSLPPPPNPQPRQVFIGAVGADFEIAD